MASTETIVDQDSWSLHVLPALRVLLDAERADKDGMSVSGEFWTALGGSDSVRAQRLIVAMKDDGLINAKLTTTGSGNVSGFAEGLTAEGRRRIGDWPSPESVLPRLAELLESAVQNEDSQERKEPLRALLGALGQVTTGGLGNVVGTLIGQAAGVT